MNNLQKMMHVRRSKEPLISQLEAMANNLKILTKDSVKTEVSSWSHEGIPAWFMYRFWIAAENHHYEFKTWQELQEQYYVLVKKYRRKNG